MKNIIWAGLALLLAIVALPGRGESPARSEWNGFDRLDFVVDGRKCLLVLPRSAAPGKPWIWRTEFFGHEPQADLALLNHGFHVAYVDVQNMYGAPVAMRHMDVFYDHVTRNFGLSRKTVLEGFSRGGLFAFNWAARRPDRVAAIYADAPVLDFKSWPAGRGKGKGSPADWERLLRVYELTESEALAYRRNPIDNLEPLARARIPLLHVCGETDNVVPIEENTRIVEQRYRKLGGSITVIAKPFCNHHPHSLKDPTRIVNFVLRSTGHAGRITKEPATPYGYDYFLLRNGLPNSRRRFEQEGIGRIALVGAPAMAHAELREQLGKELRRHFPRTRFQFVGSGDLPHNASPNAAPRTTLDLVLIEAVLGGETSPGTDERIRRLKQENPNADLVLLHLADPSKLAAFRRGEASKVIASDEEAATGYGIPSIDLAREIAERVHAGEFTWDRVFSSRSATRFAHQLYARSIARLLAAAWGDPANRNQ